MEILESVVRMVSALGIVLALILGLLAIARSAIGRRFLPLAGTPLVRILADSSIGSRKHVLLIAVAGEVLILGTTPTDLVPLGKITDPERLKQLLVDPMGSPSTSGAAVSSDDLQKGHRAS
jgi:flagellar protein FliO/FliZ